MPDDRPSLAADGMMLRNHWYVAAWSDEVGRDPVARVLLGDMIVLYRREDGTPVALDNRCPHRNLPLSEGRLHGDDLECGYHGMVFGSDGQCLHLPGSDTVPDWASMRSYPVLERQGWVLVWMGEAAAANDAAFPGLRAGYPRTGSLERRKCGEGAAGPASLRVRALAQTST